MDGHSAEADRGERVPGVVLERVRGLGTEQGDEREGGQDEPRVVERVVVREPQTRPERVRGHEYDSVPQLVEDLRTHLGRAHRDLDAMSGQAIAH